MTKTMLILIAVMAAHAQLPGQIPQYTPAGELLRPKDYREWIYLSSGLGMTYGPGGADQQNPRFDNVFVNPSSYRAFLETGRWPDKSIFILEVRQSIGKGSINNGGHYQGEVISVEAAVKDESRFPQKWAYFGFGRGEKASPAPATSSCNVCHSKNAAVENSFVQFYPALLDIARQKGTLNASYLEKTAAH